LVDTAAGVRVEVVAGEQASCVNLVAEQGVDVHLAAVAQSADGDVRFWCRAVGAFRAPMGTLTQRPGSMSATAVMSAISKLGVIV
jgi:hypothetical protein